MSPSDETNLIPAEASPSFPSVARVPGGLCVFVVLIVYVVPRPAEEQRSSSEGKKLHVVDDGD